ncbi:hypothetical protein O0I10_009442 [Lichtheimia ornata]|uniref:Protein-S-isoprenylcysteine O-methyltransferase n=1 Tax=Lichtheimia ornata TaxID=688661 RepID=A0AAD7XYP2_9FUNG|nr:uncharacterized protein O0I10_009442 [Lichtheimia ornata]KAJ8654877.1 hypothetical protein O0I10_009442 [Lichtheimia ornata]
MTDNIDHLRAVMGSDDDDNDMQFETRQTVSEQPATTSGNRIRLVRPSSTMDRGTWSEFSSHQEPERPCQDTIRLFDGENTPQNISSYGFLLGIACGGGLVFAFLSNSSSWHVPQFGLFLAALALFHFLEYLATALFNPDKLTLDSFLINHSAHYHAAHAVAFLEFMIEYYFFPSWKTFGMLNYLGLALVIVGQACRTVAMFSARHNFSHHIADYKAKDHVLVTHGIYSIMRHPSYFGFYWWAVGVQFLLMNPICLILFIYWLQRFFAERITYEEYTLLRFFGNDWTVYKAKTPTWMPLIP